MVAQLYLWISTFPGVEEVAVETVLEGDASVGDIKIGPEVTSQKPL